MRSQFLFAIPALAVTLAAQSPATQKPALPAQAGNSADWMEPFEPFRIAGNLYYVGTRGLANYLITTPAGHILINSDLEENVPQIKASVEKLGFKFSDVKILLINHAHWDHDAGSATIKKMTGAQYAVMEGDVPVVESGGKADFHYGADTIFRYTPAKVDRVLHDGDEVKLGGTTLVAHLTPGHTKGNTTWTMKVTDGGRTYDAVIVGSWNVNPGYKLVNNAAYPTIASDYERTFRTLRALPCDLFLGAHGGYFGMEAKVAKPAVGGANPFVDAEGYRRQVDAREKAFRDELAKQRAAAGIRELTGVVFGDANGNGRRDAGERGVAGIVVSNQDEVAVTDGAGVYHLPSPGTGLVFVSVPDGYRAVGPFWRRADDTAGATFALRPVAKVTGFSFVHASDTHISPASQGRTQRLRELADSVNPAFVIITGDLVRDALRVGEDEARGYYELFASEIAKFRAPVFTVPGNHENFGIERAQSKVSATHPLYARGMYHQFRGPDYYSFSYGGVHFVALNSVDIDDQWYYGHVDARQMAWLARDLATIPAAMPVVTFNHIPFFTAVESINGYTDAPPAPTVITVDGKTAFRHTVSNAKDVLATIGMSRFPLALGGHMHVRESLRYDGIATRFEQAAAIVGGSGGGVLPFPSGISVYTVRDGHIDPARFIPLDRAPAK